jgi:hypothetical protein
MMLHYWVNLPSCHSLFSPSHTTGKNKLRLKYELTLVDESVEMQDPPHKYAHSKYRSIDIVKCVLVFSSLHCKIRSHSCGIWRIASELWQFVFGRQTVRLTKTPFSTCKLKTYFPLRFGVLTAVTMKITVFWTMTPYGLVDRYEQYTKMSIKLY